jgi:predicted nucleotidyltransferase
MTVEIKRAVRAGNSSAVILPRAWLNQEVRIELVRKTPAIILRETIEIITKYISLSEIIGIYLVGSYARGDEQSISDIDVLVISRGTDTEEIRDGAYSITLISEKLLHWKLENDILPIGPMILEAKPLLNAPYIEKIAVNVTRKNASPYLVSTKEKIEMIRRAIIASRGTVESRVVYTLVLRIRTLHILQKIISKKKYSTNEFTALLLKISSSREVYLAYQSTKTDSKETHRASKDACEKLLVYLEGQIKDVEGKV